MRIVSLVPSLTHMLCELGFESQIVGCTAFCVDPASVSRSAVIVGGTKDPDMTLIECLSPTHILVNDEENRRVDIECCQNLAATLLTFPKTVADVPAMLRSVGAFLGAFSQANRVAENIEREIFCLSAATREGLETGKWRKRRFLYYIWRSPYMVAGHDTYISSLLELLGFVNVAPRDARYPELPVEAAIELGADLLLLASEPYPFRRRDGKRLRLEWPTSPEMVKIDGKILSWYGTLTLNALHQLKAWVGGAEVAFVKPILFG